MCDCLHQIKRKLEEDPNINEPILGTKTTMNFKTGKTTERAGHLDLSYRRRKKNGDLYKNRTTTFIGFTNCPFCGKHYNQKLDFKNWIEEIAKEDNHFEFLLNGYQTGEIFEWHNWWTRGLSPQDAVKKNYELYG